MDDEGAQQDREVTVATALTSEGVACILRGGAELGIAVFWKLDWQLDELGIADPRKHKNKQKERNRFEKAKGTMGPTPRDDAPGHVHVEHDRVTCLRPLPHPS